MASRLASEVDYIVVGGGSAGCVVASRLSEDASISVCMLEYGRRNNSALVRWPAGYAKLQGEKNRYEWMTVPQKHLQNRRIPTPQGKLLGGGSSVNSMVYIRGNRNDYDNWAELGNDRWSYADVLSYFRKSEDNERLDDEFHGVGGPLGVSDQRSPCDLTRMFLRAGQELGYRFNHDFNGTRQAGVGFLQVTQRNVRRCSAAHAFIYPAESRPNLKVMTGVRVTRVLVENGRAIAVEYAVPGSREPQVVRARREVVVSGGAINTPKILLLSGIGPADEIARHGLKPVHDLPGVGKNLQDHLSAFTGMRLNKPISYSGQDKGLRAIRHGIEFLMFGTGAITSCVVEGGLFMSTTGNDLWPDTQMHFIPAGLSMHKEIVGHGITLAAANLRPQSRGEVALASGDFRDEPLIDPKFLSEEPDLRRNIDGIKAARELLHTRAFSSVFQSEESPGPDIRTDKEIGKYVREVAKTDFHPVGTCKMGSDKMAVVDQDLKMHGLEGLRVIDASVMPAIISGNTNAASIMIGERGADAILGRRLSPAISDPRPATVAS
ncbi:GMC family oxidoreductase [Mesorhizobium argentiipisi]|uniref:GMC family oxidoreductase N-terminal domain-containing protein n=1 Tax=Mesorhizobium argentiipisi TaxID=3015175 RepID=A0ABU8KBY4_9HYPH